MLALRFTVLLDLIDERSAALREAAAQAGPRAAVPACPGWSVRDLLTHVGQVQRFWAVVVAGGPGQSPPEADLIPDLTPGADLLAWSAEATAALRAALLEAGPERRCWTWWGSSPAPEAAGAVARHQVQEAAVHARDAQQANGRAQPVPEVIAGDGVDEFLTVGLGSAGAWPHEPGVIAVAAAGVGRWQVDLGPAGAVVREVAGGGADRVRQPDAVLSGSASDLVLFLYGRGPDGAVAVTGDPVVVDRLLDWAPTN